MDSASPRFRQDLTVATTEADGVPCVDVSDAKTGAGFGVAHVDARNAVRLGGGHRQILSESRAGGIHLRASLQARFGPEQLIVAWRHAPPMDAPKSSRAFVYRAGVRIAGTVVACDASAGSDLVFLSHAAVLGARGRRALPRLGAGGGRSCRPTRPY